MQAVVLNARVREIFGKKVKKLRREGLLPVGIYGKEIKSEALSIPLKDFMTVYGKVGETGLVELKYDGKSKHVLVRNVQIHPVSRMPLHVELQAVKLTEKIKANVPLELVGESPAVTNNIGVLLQTLSEIEIEALPTELPENIEVNVEKLANVDDQITVGQLKVSKEVAVLSPETEIVVKVAPAVSEETAKELAAEEAAKAAAATEAAPTEEGTQPETPAAPEAPKETSEEK